MDKISLAPSKPISKISIIGLCFLLLFGIGFAFLVGSTLAANDAPLIMSILFYIFMSGWIGTALFMLIFHIVNLKSTKGLSFIDINSETVTSNKTELSNTAQKLRDLEELKKEKLITETEYLKKRSQIIEDKW